MFAAGPQVFGDGGALKYPAFEAFGNHDGGRLLGPGPSPNECNHVRANVRARTLASASRAAHVTSTSPNGLHYRCGGRATGRGRAT